MAEPEAAFADERADLRFKFGNANEIGDAGSIEPDAIGDLLLCQPEPILKLTQRITTFDRIKVGALHVLDEGQPCGGFIVNVSDDCGDGRKASDLGGPPPPLPGDELVPPPGHGSHHDGLQQALPGDRLGEGPELRRVKGTPRLERTRRDEIDVDLTISGP